MILHIANDFSGSRVYSQLLSAIDRRGIPQTVFTTIRKEKERGRNAIQLITPKSVIHYSDNWRLWHRAFFGLKATSNYKHLLQLVDPHEVTHVHAHTLFSDGVLALKLHKEYGIPYTVSIRNTDLNVFMRFMRHTWSLGSSVIRNAHRVICISPAHIQRVARWSACPEDFEDKVINIPNGVNTYWLDHMSTQLKDYTFGSTFHLLYIGNFSSNKNVPRLMRAVLDLKHKGRNLNLHIIGGGGRDTAKIESMAKTHSDIFHLYGILQDKEQIRSIMRQCYLFAMPSLAETFGLVYVEALTQGLPILYTAGEGVDGFFETSYGERCNPSSVQDISSKIEYMMTHYDDYLISENYLRANFNWDKVATKYLIAMELDKNRNKRNSL